ncbi:hypothetical protein LOC67_18055 [Stieleria sp. JC731]|uniref:hypothetical protein n=1 Tax=Pirellulaceae TaxID=2691357 RepID=UPI001E4FCC73|nr:hypothetical protein [Stieleria sp. JC731]MCC9602458.1 hypothetical protein [Stieleria sp. JC731]
MPIETKLGQFFEKGSILIGEYEFSIRKHGMLGGRWTLDDDGQELIEATKTSAFTRTFEIDAPQGRLILQAHGFTSMAFDLNGVDGTPVAKIVPDHIFTRRSTIQVIDHEIDTPTLVFSFWLVTLIWHRQHSSG